MIMVNEQTNVLFFVLGAKKKKRTSTDV